MQPLYPVLAALETLPRRALVFAPHPDDEVFGCGAVMAFHAARGDALRVVVASDGAAGDPRGLERDLPGARQAESRAAGEALGVRDYRFLGIADGALGATADLVARLKREIEEFAPEVLYAPSPQEYHSDHRALAAAALAALSARAAGGCAPVRALFYGVNCQNASNVVFDTSALWPRKEAAIRCFTSQAAYQDLVGKNAAVDLGRVINVEDPAVVRGEGFADVAPERLAAYRGALHLLLEALHGPRGGTHAPERATTAVICSWNKRDFVRDNLDALRAQTLPFAEVIVVDNCSSDGTQELVARDYPEVRLIQMPHSAYGACETFNIGFASASTPLVAILDDDVILPPEWLEKTSARLLAEPPSTAIVSTKVVEPGMPQSYVDSPAVNRERYMSTFRGCGSLARRAALLEAGGYDERLFIYGNERDLTCRLLNLGYRVLQYPGVTTFHRNPFGVRMGKRSLYYHARNAWLTQLKHAPLEDLFRMPFAVLSNVLLRGHGAEQAGEVTDATGTIGIGRALRETPGAPWILLRAAAAVLYNVPYCLRRRRVCTAPDYELPVR